MMGSPTSEINHCSDELQHQVTPYLMSKTEVTQAVWERVMTSFWERLIVGSNNPSHFKGPNLPVECVSWDECMAFCQKTGLSLPTEAQWEFACRAGTKSAYYFGDDSDSLENYAWYDDNSGDQTHPVAQKKAECVWIV